MVKEMTTVRQFVNLGPAEEQQWLERFLGRELDAATADAFEAYALDKQHLLDQIEADHLLTSTLPQLVSRGEMALPLASRRKPRARSWLAIAAGIAVGAVGGWLLRSPAPVAPMHWVSPERLVFETVRGATDRHPLHEENRAATPSPVVIVDVVLPPLATLVEARLQGASGPLSLPQARPDRDGVLSLVLERRLLADTELVLSLKGPDGVLEEQRFALDRQPARRD